MYRAVRIIPVTYANARRRRAQWRAIRRRHADTLIAISGSCAYVWTGPHRYNDDGTEIRKATPFPRAPRRA